MLWTEAKKILFTKKRKTALFHVVSATMIVTYWWAVWNLLDTFLLGHARPLQEVTILLGMAVISILLLIFIDFDLGDL